METEKELNDKRRSKLYIFAIIAQEIHLDNKHRYYWERVGKYKKLQDAEKAIKQFTSSSLSTHLYKIVPYFEGHYWIDRETEIEAFRSTNSLLWNFITRKGLKDEAHAFLNENRDKKKKFIWF